MSNALGAIVAGVMLLGYLYLLVEKKQSKNVLLVYFIVTVITGIILYFFKPPSDLGAFAYTNPNLFTVETLQSFSKYILGAFSANKYLTILEAIPFFASNLNIIVLVAGWLLWVASLITLVKNKRALIFVFITQVIMMSFMAWRVVESYRHLGILFAVYLFGLWIANSEENIIEKIYRFVRTNFIYTISSIIITLLLFIQVLASIAIFIQTYRTPFSNSKAVAQFMKSDLMTDNSAVFAGFHSYASSAISAYFDKPFIYSIEHKKITSFEYWNKEYADNGSIPIEEIEKRVNEFCQSNKDKKCYLILDSTVGLLNDSSKYKVVITTNGAMTNAEDYNIYLVLNNQN
jgi:hypothetical protein